MSSTTAVLSVAVLVVTWAPRASALVVGASAVPAAVGKPSASLAAAEVRTPEGIRLRFPRGFAPRTEESKDGTSYVATRGKELVGATIREAEVDCDAAAGQAPGTEIFETAGGLAACAFPPASADGHSLAIVVVGVGRLAVTIVALAPPDQAAQRARAFADALRVDRAPRAVAGKTGRRLDVVDRRLVGCWRIESEGGSRPPLQTTVITAFRERRCFVEDGTFTAEDVRMVSTSSGFHDSRGSASGVWGVLDGTLLLADEDGDKLAEPLRWDGPHPVLDGRRWEREDDE